MHTCIHSGVCKRTREDESTVGRPDGERWRGIGPLVTKGQEYKVKGLKIYLPSSVIHSKKVREV